MIGASPSKVTPEMVRGLMDAPPRWLSASYIAAYKSGRYTLEDLAYAVTAVLKLSPYDDDVVDEVVQIMRALGYRDSCAPPPPARALTELGEANAEDTDWM